MFHLPARAHLAQKDIAAVHAFAKLCRQDIIEMTANAKSGHPGGSCSVIDILATLYATISHIPTSPKYSKRDRVIVSAGHLSPAVYAVLGEMGYFPIEQAKEGFRKFSTPFEGHVSHQVPGVEFTNGSLGKGLSESCGVAQALLLEKSDAHVYCIMGDGEQEEGQVAEARRSASKYALSNLTVIIDNNHQQLDSSVEEESPALALKQEYLASGFLVYEIDGHDVRAIYHALLASRLSSKTHKKPAVIIARTLMGKGISFMEREALAHKSTWHGKAPSEGEKELALKELALSDDDFAALHAYGWQGSANHQSTQQSFAQQVSQGVSSDVLAQDACEKRKTRSEHIMPLLHTGESRIYLPGDAIDNRTAFGNALLDLARLNPKKVLALTCDVASSLRMSEFAREFPVQFFDEGISEGHMVSKAGALSLEPYCVFAGAFGAFLSTLASDQMRINDINNARLKVIATHCGTNVAEDGVTHQCITDLGFARSLFNTLVVEPADPNQTDKIIRAIANIPKNVYVRMGRSSGPVLAKSAQVSEPFYDASYVWDPKRIDMLEQGTRVLVFSTGAAVAPSLAAARAINALYNREEKGGKPSGKIGPIGLAIPCSYSFSLDALQTALRGVSVVVIVEDHVASTGLGGAITFALARLGASAKLKHIACISPSTYQSSGTADELAQSVGISQDAIEKTLRSLLE